MPTKFRAELKHSRTARHFQVRLLRMVISFCAGLIALEGHAQPGNVRSLQDEGDLYAQVKQVGQFIHRFNAEETPAGERLNEGQNGYRNPVQRKKFLNSLFDEQNPYFTDVLKQAFIRDMTEQTTPFYLSLHGGGWLAEVRTRFLYKGQPKNFTLFMTLQEQPVGSKWVIYKVFSEVYEQTFDRNTTRADSFLHPLSHELDFMNLSRLFRQHKWLAPFAAREFVPDQFSLFIYDQQLGNLSFQQVESLKFHVMQAPNWYFEISEFNRAGYNKGWLISKLTQIPDDKKGILTDYIFKNYRQ